MSRTCSLHTRYRIAQVGCGGICPSWMDVWVDHPEVCVVALVDIVPEHAQAIRQRYDLDVPIFTTLTEARQHVDFNLVCNTPTPDAHAAIFHEALDLGCDVLSEKPLAESLEQARDMVTRAAREQKTFAVMQNRRYLHAIRAARELAHQVGPIGYAGADFFIGAHFGGFRDIMDYPLLLDMAIHTFDQARFLLDADAVAVYCNSFNPPGSWYAGHASAVATFEMSNGAVFCYRGSWCSEGTQGSWQGVWRIQGALGAVEWDGETMPTAHTVPMDSDGFIRTAHPLAPPPLWENGTHPEGHAGCLTHMIEALKAGREPETAGHDNIKSLSMVLAAIESAERKQRVEIE